MATYSIANPFALMRRRWLLRIAFHPFFLNELIKLLCPEHATEGLPHNLSEVVADRTKNKAVIELVCFFAPLFDGVIKQTLVLDGRIPIWLERGELESDNSAPATGRYISENIVCCRFRSFLLRVYERRS
jgi:hypothetical protein